MRDEWDDDEDGGALRTRPTRVAPLRVDDPTGVVQRTDMPTRAGDFRQVRGKTCWCGAVGEWPGRLCPDCKNETPERSLPEPMTPVADLDDMPEPVDRRHHHGSPYTDEDILARIRLWAKVTGRPPTKADWTPARLRDAASRAHNTVLKHVRTVALYESGDWPSETTVRERFGSMNGALIQAGFPPRETGRQPKSERPFRKPPTGERALEDLYEAVRGARAAGVKPGLKAALYDLATSAIIEADRIPGS